MGSPKHWLMKTEPGCYSIDDLARDKETCWDGVRNYQARNFMREMKLADLVLYYYSNADPSAVAGIARVCRTAYPDHTALDKKEQHYDPKATKENPIWMMVDVAFVEKFAQPVSLEKLRSTKGLDGMLLLQRGQRLSVMPVDAKHFDIVCKLGRAK